jgi:hypothetical protein
MHSIKITFVKEFHNAKERERERKKMQSIKEQPL